MRFLLFTFFAFVSVSNAQTDSSAVLRGYVKDEQDEALIGVSLKVMQNGIVIKGTITDYDGRFECRLPKGMLDLQIDYTGFESVVIRNIQLTGDLTLNEVKMQVTRTREKGCINIFYKIPLIIDEPGNTGTTLTSDQIRKMY